MWLMLLLFLSQLMAQNIPEYREDLDRLHNMTWNDRPKWSQVTPNEVTVFYADIPESLKADIEHKTNKGEFYLPKFADVKNRIFWIQNTDIFHEHEVVARKYKRRVNQLKKYLARFNIPIRHELIGVPLTSHSTLKVYHPDKPSDFVFLKVLGSEAGLFVSDFLTNMSKVGMVLSFYPEISYKKLGFSNLKRPKRNKTIFFPGQVLRSAEVISHEDLRNDYAISLHSVLSDQTLLNKLVQSEGLNNVMEWYKEVYVEKLASFFFQSYYVLGILPGAHSQNLVAIIDKDYRLKRFVWRDLVDMSYNPIVSKSNFGLSIVSTELAQINKTGSEGVPFLRMPIYGTVAHKTVSTRTFADFFGELMGQVFRVKIEKEMSFLFRHELIVEFFEIFLNSKFPESVTDSVINKMKESMSQKPDVIEFAKAAGGIFNEFFTQYQTRKFPVNEYTKNYTRTSLIKAFVESLKNNSVGFYDNYPHQWIKWQKKEKYQNIVRALEQSQHLQLVSNGHNLLMIKDTNTNKWVAMSFYKHNPSPFDYLKHQKLLRMNIDTTYFRHRNDFHCKAMFY